MNHMIVNSVWGRVAQLIDTQGTSTFTKNRTRDVSTVPLAQFSAWLLAHSLAFLNISTSSTKAMTKTF